MIAEFRLELRGETVPRMQDLIGLELLSRSLCDHGVKVRVA
jgi:hypothetical protein